MTNEKTAAKTADLLDVQENDETKRFAIILSQEDYADLRALSFLDKSNRCDSINQYAAHLITKYLKSQEAQDILSTPYKKAKKIA